MGSLRWEPSHDERGLALLEAVVSKQWPTAEVLLAAGVPRHHLDHTRHKHGMTALHLAASASGSGAPEVIKALLARGASSSVYNSYGRTPLHEACFSGRAKAVRALLEGDADTSALVLESKEGRAKEIGKTPLELANLKGHSHLRSYFLESEVLAEGNVATNAKSRELNGRQSAWNETSASKGKQTPLTVLKDQPRDIWHSPTTAKGKKSYVDYK